MDATSPDLVRTRESLHRLAEHVVAPARYAATGRIGLRAHSGGLRTPAFGEGGTVVAVELGDLVVREGSDVRRRAVTTLRQAAEFVGVTPGAPASVYPPATPCDLDAALTLDATAMQVLGDWYLLGEQALSSWATEVAEDDPSEAQLWPEHLDLALTAGGVNYGISPGDATVAEPYAYVGPHGGPPVQDGFWNAPFGAARGRTELVTEQAALSFFRTARERLAGAISPEGARS